MFLYSLFSFKVQLKIGKFCLLIIISIKLLGQSIEHACASPRNQGSQIYSELRLF